MSTLKRFCSPFSKQMQILFPVSLMYTSSDSKTKANQTLFF